MKISKHSWLSALRTTTSLFVVLALATALPGQTKANPDEQIPLIKFEDVSFDVAIDNLARQAELNYIVGAKLPDQTLTRRFLNMSAKSVLKQLLAEHKLFLVENSATTVAQISSSNRIKFTVDAQWLNADTNEILPLIQFQEVTLGTALNNIARVGDMRIILDPRLTSVPPFSWKQPLADQVVTVRWANIRLRQAIAAFCENYNLKLVISEANGSIHIKPK